MSAYMNRTLPWAKLASPRPPETDHYQGERVPDQHPAPLEDTNPFTSERFEQGYSPRTFMTNRGTESTEPVPSRIKLNKHIHDIAYSKFVNNDEYPEYDSLSAFINDCCWHRIHYLETDYQKTLSEDEIYHLDLIGRYSEVANQASRKMNSDKMFRETVTAVQTAMAGDDPSHLRSMMAKAMEVKGRVTIHQMHMLQELLAQAEHRVAEQSQGVHSILPSIEDLNLFHSEPSPLYLGDWEYDDYIETTR